MINRTATQTDKVDSTVSWPASTDRLPIFVTQRHLAGLLGCSERKLERDRHHGIGIPFTKLGRRVLYAREHIMAALEARTFHSTAEARTAGAR